LSRCLSILYNSNITIFQQTLSSPKKRALRENAHINIFLHFFHKTRGPCGKMRKRQKNTIFPEKLRGNAHTAKYFLTFFFQRRPLWEDANTTQLFFFRHTGVFSEQSGIFSEHNRIFSEHNKIFPDFPEQNGVLLEHNAGWDRQKYQENGRIFPKLAFL